MAKRNLMNGAAVPMESGERNKAVKIQQLTEDTAESQFPKESWTTLANPVWMRRMTMKASERFAAGMETGADTVQWEMGYRPDMDPELVDVVKKRRLSYQGRTYDIVSASLIGQREGVELMTLSGSGGAL